MHISQGLLVMMIGLVLTGCGRATYDFSPYDNHYSDTEMMYEPGYIVRDSGEAIPYIPKATIPTRIP